MYQDQIRPLLAAHARLLVPVDQLADDADLYEAGLTSLSTVNLNAQYYRTTSLLSNITDDNKLVTLGLSHQFSPRTTGTVELRRYQGSFNQIGSDFRENAISAYLSMRL